MSRCLYVPTALAGALLSLGLIAVGPPSAAQAAPQVFTIRYLCFLATPKPGNAYRPDETPPAFENLQNGSTLTLGPTPEAFIAQLHTNEPQFTYGVLLAGAKVCTNLTSVAVQAGPMKGDPAKVQLTDTVLLEQNSSTTVRMRHTGALSWTDQTANGESKSSLIWEGAVSDKVGIGRTYSHGVLTLENGMRLVYTYSILKGRIDG